MGLVRLLLAVSVVLFHVLMFPQSGAGWLRDLPLSPIPGTAAVEAFFLISGFAISGALATKYRTAGTFYVSRIRRLFPAYLAILALELLGAVYVWDLPGFHKIWREGQDWSILERAAWVWTNVAMLGKELWQFTDRLGFEFVSPAWSLSIELQFYLLAPLIVRLRTPTLVALLIAALVARAGMVQNLPYDPFVYYTLPGQACLFLLGALAYRLRVKLIHSPIVAALLVAAATMAFPQGTTAAPIDLWKLIYFAVLFALLPSLSHEGRVDSYLAALSYPLYLIHLPVIYVLLTVWSAWPWWGVFAALGLSLAGAALVHELVEKPARALRFSALARAA